MPAAILPKVNSSIRSGLRRVISQSGVRNSKALVSCEGKSVCSTLRCCSTLLVSGSSRYNFGMAASLSSKPVFGGDLFVDDLIGSSGYGLDFAKPTGVDFSDRSRSGFLKASLSLKRKKSFNSRLASVHVGPWSRNFHASGYNCYATGAAKDVSLDGNSKEEQFANTTVLFDLPVFGERTLKLLSGACYLPHPQKEEIGGEDAHFICEDSHAIGVADGVGGWADVGVNAGLFSLELMAHSLKAIQEEPIGNFEPARVLEKAHSCTKAKGSSTVCIIGLTEKGLHAINLGDSGFIVVRDGSTIFRSPSQQHGFNMPYQLESGNGADLPSSGEVFLIPVAAGDIIIAGTDGLFDNLYNNEITAIIVHATRTGLDPQATAKKIAALARQRALDKNRRTPFSAAAQDAGFRYYGGKLDDVTVIVSYITSSTKV